MVARDAATSRHLSLVWVLETRSGALKARLLAIPFGREPNNKDELLCPAPCAPKPIVMLVLAARNGWQVRTFDVSRALLHTQIREDMFLQPPAEMNLSSEWGLHINCTMYGLSEAMADFDAHFGAAEVNRLLYECGEELVREGGGAGIGGAAELFSLAGQYGALLSLLNRELATRLNAWEGDAESEGRKFWKNAAVNFQQAHLAHGRTHVIEVLEQEGSLAVGETFQLLLNLMSFFDKFRMGEFEGAWALLDMLNLLPRAESELPTRVSGFHGNLDNVVKTHFPQIVLTGMECLFHQHTSVKQSILGSGAAGTSGGSILQTAAVASMERRLVEIRERARLLVTYTGLLHHKMPGDANAQIARMEAYMM